MINFKNRFFLYLLLAGLLTGCGGKEVVKALLHNRTPYETYSHNLKEANLHKTSLGQSWLQAGQKALLDSVLINLPYQETGYFKAEKPLAASYAFKARQGEMIDINVTTRTRQNLKIFLDLFGKTGSYPQEAKHILAADTTSLHLQHTVTEDLTFLVRLQPELLQSGSYTITIGTKPSLGFPVQGKNSSSVQSFWGADRDGGSRKHEGVDIFAPKGTPVIASTKGIISRVNETPIGGKVVWLTDRKGRQSLYYAHLDKQLVTTGQEVNPGDTLGLIGNTGNAKGTVPHLHFGIYTFGYGAIDPFPFIKDENKKPAPLNVKEEQLGEWARVAQNQANLRKLPEEKATVIAKLPKHTAFQVVAGTGNWFKIQTPDGISGYLHKTYLESLQKPVQTKTLKAEAEITEMPVAAGSPIGLLKKDSKVAIVGFFQAFQLVKLADGTLGWVLKS